MITNILAGRYHFNHRQWRNVSKEGVNFVRTLLHPDYTARVRSKEALDNPWLSDNNLVTSQAMVLKSFKSFRAASNMKRSQSATELQRTGMVAVVFGLQPGVVSELRSVFQSMDVDASGTLCKKEFIRAMNVSGRRCEFFLLLRLLNSPYRSFSLQSCLRMIFSDCSISSTSTRTNSYPTQSFLPPPWTQERSVVLCCVVLCFCVSCEQ